MEAKPWEHQLATALREQDFGAVRSIAELQLEDRESRDRVLDLVAAAAATGSNAALELLIEIVDRVGLARKGVARHLINETSVEDAAQDTLVSVATSIRSFDLGRGRFVTWLFQIARNRAYDHLRRAKIEVPLPADYGEARKISSLIATRITVQRLVEQLPPHYREALIARDLERLTYPETAQRLGVPVNTAKSHVRRGRAQLAAQLENSPH